MASKKAVARVGNRNPSNPCGEGDLKLSSPPPNKVNSKAAAASSPLRGHGKKDTVGVKPARGVVVAAVHHEDGYDGETEEKKNKSPQVSKNSKVVAATTTAGKGAKINGRRSVVAAADNNHHEGGEGIPTSKNPKV